MTYKSEMYTSDERKVNVLYLRSMRLKLIFLLVLFCFIGTKAQYRVGVSKKKCGIDLTMSKLILKNYTDSLDYLLPVWSYPINESASAIEFLKSNNTISLPSRTIAFLDYYTNIEYDGGEKVVEGQHTYYTLEPGCEYDVNLRLEEDLTNQLIIDVQKNFCTKEKSQVSLSMVNHSDVPMDRFVAYQFYDDGWAMMMLNHPLIEERHENVPASEYQFSIYESMGIDLLQANRNSIKLDSGCLYTLNIFNKVDSLGYRYLYEGVNFKLPIYFDRGKSDLPSSANPILDDLVKTLNKYPNISIEVGVHADERISKELSRCNSCSRSEAVVSYLVSKGINKERLTSKGYQGSQPFLKGAETEEEHQQNRRVIVTVTKVKR
jgi:outer membrane protein OmpA-like peptidoglycan-associated protein